MILLSAGLAFGSAQVALGTEVSDARYPAGEGGWIAMDAAHRNLHTGAGGSC